MDTKKLLRKVIADGLVLEATHFPELGLPDTPNLKNGKVRDNYFLGDELLIVTTDRVSAFDVNMRQGLPFKGYVLAEQTAHMFKFVGDLGVRHHLKERMTPVCFKTIRAEPGKIEWVFRRHLYGSAWRDVRDGKFAEKYGFEIKPDMVVDGKIRKGCRLEQTICTPTTKAEEGHDIPLTEEKATELYGKSPAEYDDVETKYRALFDRVYDYMQNRGIIVPDTKFEEGFVDDEPILIDEIFTSDSSRFWPAETYIAKLHSGEDQIAMDKEYLRQWLINSGFKNQGVDLPVPVRVKTMMGYLNALKRMTSKTGNQLNRELNQYYEMMKDAGGPEMMIYQILLDRGMISGCCAVILAGSGSDLDYGKKETKRLFKTLEELKVPHSSAVVSGHKDPDRLVKLVKWADKYPGDMVFIDLTGMSNGKGPTTAGGLTSRPVLFCHSSEEDPNGTDLYSSINVPRGVPLGVYNGGINTALAAAQILGIKHPELLENVNKYKAGQRARGVEDSMKFGGSYRPG